LFKRALVFGCLAIAALPAYSATVASRTGTVGTSFAIGSGGSTSMAVNFTLGTGTSYNTLSFAPMLNTTDGSIATGSAYISSGIGAGATVLAGPVAISVPASQTTPAATTVTFTGVTIAGSATPYYLVISNGSGNLGWAASSGAGTETLGTGVTAIGADVQDLATPTPASPPTSATFTTPVSNGGSSHVLLFSLTGTVVGGGGGTPTGVPTVGEFGLIGTGALLGFSGLLFLKRRPVNPLR
jgi:hypothetical protein